MCSNDEIHILFLEKAAYDVWSKYERNTTVIFLPTCNVLVGVGPQKIANQTCVWHVCWADKPTNLIHVINLWRKSTMHADDLLIDEAANRHAIEHVAELFPELDIITAFAFVIEAINPSDRCAFVISTKLEKVLRIFYFVREHQRDCFETLLSSVDIVSQ